MVTVHTELLASGGNRNPSVADCDLQTGLVAYGSGKNIAVWDRHDPDRRGITHLLAHHTNEVRCVSFLRTKSSSLYLLAGSADRTISAWRITYQDAEVGKRSSIALTATITLHTSSINALSVRENQDVVVSGSSDGEIIVWRLDEVEEAKTEAVVIQKLSLSGLRMMPMAISHTLLPSTNEFILAVAGTDTKIAIYISDSSSGTANFSRVALLSGHEGWIRSLDFTRESSNSDSDLLLVSGSQDKYIRLWRVHQGGELPTAATVDPVLGEFGARLSNKPHMFSSGENKYSVTFEALLVGHEDWIFSARWDTAKPADKLQILSASADNSLAVWERDEGTGIWICVSRLGEIGVQKGGTTATGSAGGFWTAIWMSDNKTVGCLGATGNWRVWEWDDSLGDYRQAPALGGHTKPVRGICWSKEGSYLLSTSLDQTTRLWAEWKREDLRSWHEFSRPQIHGYDLNCIDSISESRFVSGADEKLLRVFDEPVDIADYLDRLAEIPRPANENLSMGAAIPVLGLSNKAIGDTNGGSGGDPADSEVPTSSIFSTLAHPPLEDNLSRQTLWPEHEKLYGHGYEVSAVAASHDGSVVATACKATSLDHAVLRLFDTENWYEIKPALASHSHTVLSLAFSFDDQYLLSVGRDRQWVIWSRKRDIKTSAVSYELYRNQASAHSRMILDAAWFPQEEGSSALPWFATAGRDKKVNIWGEVSGETKVLGSFLAASPITAIAILPRQVTAPSGVLAYVVAYGTEGGLVGAFYVIPNQSMVEVKENSSEGKAQVDIVTDDSFSLSNLPNESITRLAWRPASKTTARDGEFLAVASEDWGVRVYKMNW